MKKVMVTAAVGLICGGVGFMICDFRSGSSDNALAPLKMERTGYAAPRPGGVRTKDPGHSAAVESPGADQMDFREVIKNSPYSDWSARLEEFVRIDPLACAAAVNAIEDKNERFNAMNLLLFFWGKQDYGAAKAWAMSTLGEKEIPTFLGSLISGLISKDPEAAKAEVLGVESPFLKQQLAAGLAQALFLIDPKSAELWVIQSLGPLQAAEVLCSFGNICISKGDLPGAIEFISKIPFGSARNDLITALGSAYGKQDAKAALEWLNGLDKTDRELAEAYVLAGWAEKAPLEAAEHVLLSGDAGTKNLEAIVGAWSASSPEEAAKWVESKVRDPEVGKKLISSIVQQWGQSDPGTAAEFVSQMNSNGDKAYLLQLVTSSWLGRDPAEAGNFLTKLEWQDSADAVRLLVTGWTSLDSRAASEWVQNLDQGPLFDTASGSLARSIVAFDPQNAAKWASAIGETNMRRDTLSAVFAKIGEGDPASASAILQEMGLGADDYKVASAALAKGSAKR